MTSDEKILNEIKESIKELFAKIAELKVTEDERRAWIKEKSEFQSRIDDYKRHKAALELREKRLNGQN